MKIVLSIKFCRITRYTRWHNYCDQTCDQVFKMVGNTWYAMFYILGSFQETTSFLKTTSFSESRGTIDGITIVIRPVIRSSKCWEIHAMLCYIYLIHFNKPQVSYTSFSESSGTIDGINCFYTWGPHSNPRTFLCSIFAGFSLLCLLTTSILDSFFLF